MALAAAWATAARAEVITYDFRVDASGYVFGGPTFSDVAIDVHVIGDTTSTYIEDPGIAHGAINNTSARLYAGGGFSDLSISPLAGFLVLEGANAGELDYGADIGGTIFTSNRLAAPQFVGWNGISNVGPIPVTVLQLGDIVLNDGAGPDVFFTEVHDATFQASVPEPATWALLLAGFGLVGGLARSARSRRLQVRLD
jgi:hypothetical protein